jgi:serine/threonine protein kinase
MTPTTTSTCPSCGGAVSHGDRVCGICGTAITLAGSDLTPTLGQRVDPSAPTAANATTDASPWSVVGARLQDATAGEYEIFTELGRGGMAAVYLARDLALNRRVAIKVMAPGLLLGPGMMERFKQEAITVASLQHVHIVAIYGVRQIGDLHFFVMQFVPGRTLEGVLRDVGALPIPVVRAWLFQIGSALGYAHRRGVIHRDIKPGNILLNADGEAIVTDFGIAKVAESPNQTQTGTVVGTPVYMSPEQCYARELTGASDQYSLGVVAYEMLVGRPPFSGSSFALMRAHTDTPPPPLHATRPDVPPAMEAAVMRMLAKTPEERFPSLADALVSLGAGPLSPDDPLHAELQKLAAAAERLDQLGDILRTPPSPVPKTRERPKQTPHVSPAPASLPRVADRPADLPATLVHAPAPPAQPTTPPAAPPAPAATPAKRSVVRWAVPAMLALAIAGYLVMQPTVRTAPPPASPAPAQDTVTPPSPPPNASVATPVDSAPPVSASPAPVTNARPSPRVDPPATGTPQAPPTKPRQATGQRRDSAVATRPAPPAPTVQVPSKPNVVTTADTAAVRAAARLDAPPVTAPANPAPKSEAELRSEVQSVLAVYVRAIQDRDTSLIRRVFPNAGSELLTRWQTTFDDARGPIAMSSGAVDILDTPKDVAGSQVQVRARYTARFSSKAARSDQSFPVSFVAVVQRDAGGWHIASIH